VLVAERLVRYRGVGKRACSPSFLELDFSHLRAKELEIRSSAQCATSADSGAYTTLLATMMMRFMVPSPRFSLEGVMNLLRNGLLMRKTGDRRRTDLTEESASQCGFSAEFITPSRGSSGG
jgi:hypothetical protein